MSLFTSSKVPPDTLLIAPEPAIAPSPDCIETVFVPVIFTVEFSAKYKSFPAWALFPLNVMFPFVVLSSTEPPLYMAPPFPVAVLPEKLVSPPIVVVAVSFTDTLYIAPPSFFAVFFVKVLLLPILICPS